MLQKSAPYSAQFVQPFTRHIPPHFIPQQPSMFVPRGSTIPPRYLPPYQPSSSRRGNFNHYNQPAREIWCELCDWSFYSVAKLEQHKTEHRKCEIDGCSFEGHQRIVEKHIEMQHKSGLYNKLKNLESAEDIAKWREERRKNYPSAKNVELRRKAQEERVQRGERIPKDKSRFGQQRFNKQHKGQKNFNKKKRAYNDKRPNKERPSDPETIEQDSNQGIFMFKGTSEMEEFEEAKDNPLAKLVGMYGSDSESEEEDESRKDVVKDLNSQCIEPVDSEKDQRAESPKSEDKVHDPPEMQKEISENTKKKTIKRKAPKDNAEQPKRPTKIYEGLNYSFLRRKQPPTMLSRLLEKEIRHERNVLLQCVRFVVENNFLDTEK
uniref:Uncharacterized protein n=1 Tax=Phlebotomus papatasi TaxID=29031 RepID=A0A1B0DLG5_PHLPP